MITAPLFHIQVNFSFFENSYHNTKNTLSDCVLVFKYLSPKLEMYEGLKNTSKHKSSPDQGNSDGGTEATET